MSKIDFKRIFTKEMIVGSSLVVAITAGEIVSHLQDKHFVDWGSITNNSFYKENNYNPIYNLRFPYTDISTMTLASGVYYGMQPFKTDWAETYEGSHASANKFTNINYKDEIRPISYSNTLPNGVQLFRIDYEAPKEIEYVYIRVEGERTSIGNVKTVENPHTSINTPTFGTIYSRYPKNKA